jgi:beta-galactosidase
VKTREFPAQGTSTGWNTYALPQIRSTTADLHFAWDTIYEPGELKAVGYDRDAKVVAETVVHTAGSVAKLDVTIDRDRLAADARDVAHVTVRALDDKGVFVPLADNAITFDVTGPAKLVGVDNGDPASHESYKGNTRALFHGLALALVQSTKDAGEIRVTARADGLAASSVSFNTVTP